MPPSALILFILTAGSKSEENDWKFLLMVNQLFKVPVLCSEEQPRVYLDHQLPNTLWLPAPAMALSSFYLDLCLSTPYSAALLSLLWCPDPALAS